MREKIYLLDDQINDQLVYIFFAPVISVAWILGPAYKQGQPPTPANYTMIVILLAIFLPIPWYKTFRRMRERANCRLGLDAELAVGRELNFTMRDGFYVFHDFPEEKNNIDHVVVGPSGVFAVETKGRAKPDKGRGTVDAKVIYNGETLVFPDNVKETAAIGQARKQAATLAKWLSSAVGEPVKVRPALALPGWFVERKKPDDLVLLVGQGHHYARSLRGPEILSESLIARIVHQLDAKCRDVEPQAYSGTSKSKK